MICREYEDEAEEKEEKASFDIKFMQKDCFLGEMTSIFYQWIFELKLNKFIRR